MLARHLEHPVEAAHVDVPGDARALLGDRREQRREVVDGVDLVAAHGVIELADVRAVDVLEGAVGLRVGAGPDPDVRGHDALGTEALAQRRNQLRADLTQSTRDQHPPHQKLPRSCSRSARA